MTKSVHLTGASSYMEKQSVYENLIHAVNKMLDGGKYFSFPVAETSENNTGEKGSEFEQRKGGGSNGF